MTDKQLRALSKDQLYELLHEQELEIERLTAENAKLAKHRLEQDQAGTLAEASIAVSGIIQAAQSAANVYLDGVKSMEASKLAQAKKKEDEAIARALMTVKRENAQGRAELERLVRDIIGTFNSQLSSFASLKQQLSEIIDRNDLHYLLSSDEQEDRH